MSIAAEHGFVIPPGKMNYRCWTGPDGLETLFLVIFARFETVQAAVE